MLLRANWLKEIHTPLAFVALASLGGLLFYALALKQGYSPSVAWYWLLIGAIDGAMVLQILARLNRGDNGGEWRVLAQIVALKVLLSLMVVWSAPNGLFGFDPHFNLSATEAVGRWGWPIPGDAGFLPRTIGYSSWPATDFLNLTVSHVSGLSTLELARYLPGALGALSVVFLFVAGKRMFGSGHSCLLAALAMAHITASGVFHAWYVREAFAFPLLMGLVALSVKKRLNTEDRLLALVFIGAIVLYHHLTSLIAVVLLATIAAVNWTMTSPRSPFSRATSNSWVHQRDEGRGTLALSHATAFLVYGMFIGSLVITSIAAAIQQLVFLDIGSTPFSSILQDPTHLFVFYGRWGVTFVMGLTLLVYMAYRYGVARVGARWSAAELPLFLWVALVGVWTIVSNYGGVLVGADPIRLFTFGVPFLLLLFSQLVFHSAGSRRRLSRGLTALGAAAVAVFLAVNLLGLPRYVYDADGEPAYDARQVRLGFPQELYAASEWQAKAAPPNTILAGDYTTLEVMGGSTQRSIVLDPDFYEAGRISRPHDGFVLRQEMSRLAYFARGAERYRYFPLDEEKLDVLLGLNGYYLAYDNGVTRMLFVSPRSATETLAADTKSVEQ